MQGLILSANNRLTAARTRLIMEFPFLGVLALRLPLQAANPQWCVTVATDAKKLYYNIAWVLSLKEYELRFAIAHEAMHCALAHFVRGGERDWHRWNIACDFAVNSILMEAGMARPVEALYDRRYSKLSAEEIYVQLPDDLRARTLDTHLDISPVEFDEEKQQPELADYPAALSHEEAKNLSRQWKQRMVAAAQHALRTSQTGDQMRRLLDRLLKPRLSWREILAPYFISLARGDYSYSRPSRREGEVIFPRLSSRGSKVQVVIDSSGSIRKKELIEFVTEVNSLKSIAGVEITLHFCDLVLAEEGPWVYPSWESMELPDYAPGGGGTDFRPIFLWLKENFIHPDLLIYFTDGEGPFPKEAPDFPVIWVVKGYRKPPWGVVIPLN